MTSLIGIAASAVAGTRDDVPPRLQSGSGMESSPPSAITPRQIVLIEANVPDAQDLLDGLTAGAQAVLLNPDQDSVQQIAAYLTSQGIQNLAGIDLVAHGADGVVGLGTATLSAASIAGYRTQLAAIGAALAPGGAIRIDGCEVGVDVAGVSFLDQLSQATGSTSTAVAPHLVGDAAGGGSFELDVIIGTIGVAAPFTAAPSPPSGASCRPRWSTARRSMRPGCSPPRTHISLENNSNQ